MKRKAQSSSVFGPDRRHTYLPCGRTALADTLQLRNRRGGANYHPGPIAKARPRTTEPASPTLTGGATDPAPATEEPGTVTPTASSVILGETADAGQAYIDRLTFLGDSTTYGLWYYSNEAPLLTGELESEQVWTPSSGTLALFNYATATVRCPTPDGPEITIAEAAALKQPEYLVITLGVNGVAVLDGGLRSKRTTPASSTP